MQGSAWIFCLKLYYSYIFSRDEKYFSNNIYVCSTVYFLPTQTGLHSNCCVRSNGGNSDKSRTLRTRKFSLPIIAVVEIVDQHSSAMH